MNRVVAVAWAVLLACCVLTRGARAQYAPEGNAHPQTQMLSVATGSPFGDAASVTAPCAAQDKVRFARSVDLAPLRSLSVFHDGRVKVVETLARETVRSIASRIGASDMCACSIAWNCWRYIWGVTRPTRIQRSCVSVSRGNCPSRNARRRGRYPTAIKALSL